MQSIFRYKRTTTKTITFGPIRAYYWHNHIISSPAWLLYNEGNDLEKLRLVDYYSRKPLNGLWWWAFAELKLSSKGFIRRSHVKRLRVAFEETLRIRGLGKDGLPLEGGKAKDGLEGSLQLVAFANILDKKDSVLMDVCGRIVDSIMIPQNLKTMMSDSTENGGLSIPGDRGSPFGSPSNGKDETLSSWYRGVPSYGKEGTVSSWYRGRQSNGRDGTVNSWYRGSQSNGKDGIANPWYRGGQSNGKDGSENSW